jgi:hypothetical protein
MSCPTQHPDYKIKDWVKEVANGDTFQGYEDWVAFKIQSDEDEPEVQKLKALVWAECTVTTVFSTSSYSRTSGKSTHASYAVINKVISGKHYWDKYEDEGEKLLDDFNLSNRFKTYTLKIYGDGRKEAILHKK